MTETAFTLWILAAMSLGVGMGLCLAYLIWAIGTNHGSHPLPRIRFTWER